MFLQSKNKDVFLEPGGDNSLTGELYQLYALQLIAYLRRHVATVEDAEDLLLEVFLEAFEHENMLTTRDTNGQRAWLWTVARNKMIDFHRRTRHRHLVPLEEADCIMNEREPETEIIRQEAHDLLQAHVQSLPAAQQAILQLRFIGGMRSPEIAVVLNKREGAIRTMLSRALNTLRSIYEQKAKENTDGGK